jgi:4-hydroxythreonine-4-phosphate dehydrogenase
MNKPLLAITMGDPAGIGPETIVRAWDSPGVQQSSRPVVLGHPAVIQRAVNHFAPHLEVQIIQADGLNAETLIAPHVVPVLAVTNDDAANVPPGVIDARGGQAAYDALVAAAKLALAGKIAGLVTAPLHKEALHAAGHNFPGHTEMLATLCGVKDVAMALYLPPCDAIRSPRGLAIVHVTLHRALRDVFKDIRVAEILVKTELVADIMRRLSGVPPRIGVCALNPHAGEGGLFGDEEIKVIRPAVEEAVRKGCAAQGPFPADTLIARARDGEFDAIVAMYHDQGHIAIKLLAMHHAVNITLGLPIVRTSVAHGTAFDRAWQGQGETTGMVAAVQTAAKLAVTK